MGTCISSDQFSSVHLLSRVLLFKTPWTAAHQSFCHSPSPEICSNSGPSSQWCHPTISSSVTPFSSCPQSFPTSRSFPVSCLFASGGQNIGASASSSVLPMNIQGFISFKIDWFDLLAVQGTLKSLLQHHKRGIIAQERSKIQSLISNEWILPSYLHKVKKL